MKARSRTLVALFAAVVSAAVLTAGYSSSADDVELAGGRFDLRSILLPADQHPPGSQVAPIVTLREAAAKMLPGTGEPSGHVVMPRCISYFAAIGGLDSLEGYHQFGFRSNGAVFVHFAARVPRDALDMIRYRIAACGQGHQTFQGWPPSATSGAEIVGSTLTFTERPVPAMRGATTFGITQTTVFNDPDNELVRTIRQAWQCTDRPCAGYDAFVARDNLLIWVHEGQSGAIADQMAQALYNRARR